MVEPMHAAVAGWLADGPPSGAQRRLFGLLRAIGPLLQAGERVTLLWGSSPAPVLPGIQVEPVAIPGTPAWRRVRAEARLLPSVLRALDATLVDLQGLPVVKGLPVPVVLTIHDLRDLGVFRRRPAWLARWLLRRSTNRAAQLVVPSRFTAAELTAVVGTNRPVHVVANAAVLPLLSSLTDIPTEPCILHVGHLERRKNLHMLLRAYAAATNAALPPLVFAGADHGEGQSLRQLAERLGIAAQVRFLGRVDDRALARLYASARAVCVPSLYEGFGLPALEGLAAGKPTLVSAAGALPEVVGAAGVVLPPTDAEAWAAALRAAAANLAFDPRRQARAAEFSWNSAAAGLLHVWRLANRADSARDQRHDTPRESAR